MNSCDQVLDGLYLGDKNAACDLQLLAKLRISRILTAELIPLPHLVTSTFPNMLIMNVQVEGNFKKSCLTPASDTLTHAMCEFSTQIFIDPALWPFVVVTSRSRPKLRV